MMTPGQIWGRLRRGDPLISLAAFFLLAFGAAALTSVEFSATEVSWVLLQKQSVAAAIGLIAAVIAATLDIQFFRAYARVGYAVGIALLAGVLMFGETFNGTTGWFVIGGYALQPLELMKVVLVLELARVIADRIPLRVQWRHLWLLGWRTLLPVGLLLLQPDLGGALILVGIGAVMATFAGLRMVHVAPLLALLAIAGSVGWFGVFQDFQKERIRIFLDPTRDPLAHGYNVIQAKIAVGAGGLWGRGLGGGSQGQLRFLPESQTDFVFALLAEELGFVGVFVLLGAIALLWWRMVRVAQTSPDAFAAFVAVGVAAVFFVQTVVHIGANLSLLPVTGVTLPLVSYGGSALVISLLLLGIVQSAAATLPQGLTKE